MNPLLEGLPESVEIDGEHVPINSDFRVWLRMEALLGGEAEPDPCRIISLCYPKPPRNPEKAFERLIWFANLGKTPSEKETPGLPDETAEPGFSYEEDAGAIYAAFREVYRIDLFREPLHWWAFRMLLDGLPETTLFRRIVQIRAVKITGKMSKTEREYYKKAKEVYALKQGGRKRLSYEEYKDRMIRYVSQRQARDRAGYPAGNSRPKVRRTFKVVDPRGT